jgi:HupE / UreJ protein
MRQGIGEIHITFIADLPRGGADRTLTYENHHQSRLAAYLVNCLVPRDKNIRITGQNRNEDQSFYQLDFVDADRSGGEPPVAQAPLSSSLSGFAGAFRLGMRHISEGTDHLMFLLALLLPAPLLACGSRWSRSATALDSLRHILGIVTAFSVGHSLTVALAASGMVHVPSRPIEVLIAVSILLSALHAIRPMFPREAAIAAFFGLVHGLAFATALSGLGLSGWYRPISLLGFNLGIEAMQIMVVTVTMPSPLSLSRTSAYSLLRVGGALFAALAAIGRHLMIVAPQASFHESRNLETIVPGVLIRRNQKITALSARGVPVPLTAGPFFQSPTLLESAYSASVKAIHARAHCPV